MATVQQIAKKSLRLLGILQSGEEPSANEASDITESLNDLLYSWEHDGIALSHSDLLYTDTFPYPDNHINPTAYNLAVMIAPEYGKQTPAEVVAGAESGYRALQNYYLDPADLTVDSMLDSYYNPNGSSYL